MSNHLHFLIQVGVEPLSKPMRQVASEFARAMQVKLETTGHFFERRYHATLIEDTDYLFTALRYIHRNPVEARLVDSLDDYRWSSHHAYVGRRCEPWLTTGYILGKFAKEHAAAVREYSAFMAVDSGEIASPFPEGAFIFGSDEFVERIHRTDRKQTCGQRLLDLVTEACARFGISREMLTRSGRDRYLMKVRAWIAHQADVRGIATRSEVARTLGRSEGALRRAILLYPEALE